MRTTQLLSVIVVAMIWWTPSSAGLIQTVRNAWPMAYSALTVTSLDDRELKTNWNDQVQYVDLKSPVGATIYRYVAAGTGQVPLLVEMLIAMPACGIRECPVRVYSAKGDMLLDTMGCTEFSEHLMSIDGKAVSFCGARHAIPDAPPQQAAAALIKPMWHNGSLMEASFALNGGVEIRYLRPRAGLPPSFRGELLFAGRIERDGVLAGTAYTFKTGCRPAAYQVRGTYHRRSWVMLTGGSPVRDRQSCALSGFTAASPNARLEFFEATLDAVN